MTSSVGLDDAQRLAAQLKGAVTFDATVQLGIMLKRAGTAFPTDTPEERRRGAYFALGAVLDFLHVLGWEELNDPLLRLFFAIDEVESGRQPPMLAATRKPGKPGRPRRNSTATALMAVRGRVAAIQEMLMESGKKSGKRKEAVAQLALDILGEAAVEKLRGDINEPITWRTVARWREENYANTAATEAFRYGDGMTQAMRGRSQDELETLAKVMLGGLRQTVDRL